MKRPITPAYTFTPGSSTLNLSGISGFSIANLFAVIDLKMGALIYAPLAGYGYASLSGTTLTLQASMAGLSASDPLLILYDDGGKPAEDGTDITGAAMPAGGIGLRGWLSALFMLLKGGAPNAPRVAATGVLAASGDTVVLAVDGMSTAVVQLASGSWGGGPVVFEASADNQATWTAVNMLLYAGSAPVGSTAIGGLWEMACGGLTHVRVRASAGITIVSGGTTTTGGTVAATLAATNGLKSIRVGNPTANPLSVTAGKPAVFGDASVAVGGTAQTLFSGATPANGWKVANPDPAEDLWVSDSTTAAPNGLGSYRVPAGGILTTEPLERPPGPVSVYAATSGHAITARAW